MTKRKPKSQHKKNGRPTIVTEVVLAKLEQAFAMDCTVEEACCFANISRDTYYDYLKREPKFGDRVAELRQWPALKARQTILDNIEEPDHAKWYLERKKKSEFSPRQEVSGADGGAIVISLERESEIKNALDKI